MASIQIGTCPKKDQRQPTVPASRPPSGSQSCAKQVDNIQDTMPDTAILRVDQASEHDRDNSAQAATPDGLKHTRRD
ncbi:uncharacterized protein TrAtP1_011991 [Trichoderma atroviride]|uniref:uncharacterized protein n=1 Tax=Hypocrea atroviridis TaxID=63577 RepID=UPI003317E2EE|nr:hypothetical protein TrAtP1_011991 [Trichoderma atroviride]